MFKSKVFAALTLFFTILAVVSTITLARNAFAADKSDDVFVDEGDGDFDAAPTIKPDPIPEESKAQTPPAEAPKAPAIAEPRPAQPAMPDSNEIPALSDDQAAPAPAPAPMEETSAPAEPKAKKEKKKASTKKKAAKTAHHKTKAIGAGGSFVVTKDACPMRRTPASTGETMLTIKASKKIWVEDAGDGWVKGWNKAGEPGYISKDCVE